MTNLEQQAAWSRILELKDQLSLKDLAERFDTTPGAISAAFKRTGTARSPAPRDDDDLPPEPGSDDGDDLDPRVKAAMSRIRPGSKDAHIAAHAELLGKVPDGEVARKANVSVRTVASFRSRHGIPGYRGPRRSGGRRGPRKSKIEPFADLLGKVPDRVVAEKAGVSLNAVRNYRVKRGIPAAGRGRKTSRASDEVSLSGQVAWRVGIRTGAGITHAVVLADDLVDAAKKASKVDLPGAIVELARVGPLVED